MKKKNKIFGNKGEKGVPSTDPLSRHRCAHIWLILLMHYLPSAGVGVDGYFAGATTMAIHCRGHFLTGKKSLYFLLGGNKLPCLCSLQGITYELCIPIYFWVWKEIFYPNCKEKQKKKKIPLHTEQHFTLEMRLLQVKSLVEMMMSNATTEKSSLFPKQYNLLLLVIWKSFQWHFSAIYEISSSKFQEFSDSQGQQDWQSQFTTLRIKTVKSNVNFFLFFSNVCGCFYKMCWICLSHIYSMFEN